jgi:hypothetical protein
VPSFVGQRVAALAADDDDLSNWTVWLQRSELPAWMAGYIVEEWLPEGVEPPWTTHE